MARGRSPWGSVRTLPSGRYQARYKVGGQPYTAPLTFETRRDAEAWLAATRTEVERGGWTSPDAARVPLREYARAWVTQRDLRSRTVELYEGLLRRHVLPALGDLELGEITPARVRAWHAAMLRAESPGRSTAAKCYRLLKAMLNTAVDDEVLAKNPCTIRGAGVERPPERPVATIEQVYELADAVGPRYRAMVLTAAFTGLRLGELLALRRRSVDLLHAEVAVVEQLHETDAGELRFGPPKSDAGGRTVAVPASLRPELEEHLARYAAPGVDGLMFCGQEGQPLRRPNVYTIWNRARRAVGVPELHFHDLRHTGNTLAAATGASTKELMSRMGHGSPRAALIYQHATRDRDHAIARALDDMIQATKSEVHTNESPRKEST